MSFSTCPLCYSPLVGYPGSPCTNGRCVGSLALQGAPTRIARPRAPLSGQVTERVERGPTEQAARRANRRAVRAARRRNRGAR